MHGSKRVPLPGPENDARGRETAVRRAGAAWPAGAAATPEDEVRTAALALFDAIAEHRWLATRLTLQIIRKPVGPVTVGIFERLGRQVGALGVPRARWFDATSTLVHYILGAVSQNARVEGDTSGIDPGAVGADPDAREAPAPRDVSHFAGMSLDAGGIDASALPFRLPGPAMGGFMTSLEAVSTVLAKRAATLGVEIVRGVPVTDVAQDEDGVTATAGGQEYRGRWLVGCDGGRSTVRRLVGFDFVGTDPLFTGYVAKVTFADPEQLPLGFNPTPTGMYLRAPFEGYLGMNDFDGGTFDRSQPLTREHLQAVLRRVSGTDVTLTGVELASSFTDRAMQATGYRKGRVLLAGDAAHIHAPLGGQGLNLGIGDAANLGWKLAATVHGTAPEGLLDTYTDERNPVGAAVLDWSRAQVAAMRPGPDAPALRKLILDLMSTPDGVTHVYRQTSGLFHRNDLGSEQPLVGRSAPDFRFTDGTRLGELLRQGQGVLLDFGRDRELRTAAEDWPGRLRYAAGPVHNDLGLAALFVRPDGVVAWADDHADSRAFRQAATRWLGHPHDHCDRWS